MDYAQYVSRRPPSPPPIRSKHRFFVAPHSASSTASSLSIESSYTPRATQRPPSSIHTTEAVSTQLHRRAVRDEYASLAAQVNAAADAECIRDRQEVVRIRLEDMLTHADARSLRVLHIALEKCNAKLDSLTVSTRPIEEARCRMRVIESKHFHGAKAATLVPQELRSMHIRREGIATLVDHIQCTLHDQVRIYHILTTLSTKLSFLRALLYSMDRADRITSDGSSDRTECVPTPPSSPTAPRASMPVESTRRSPLSRRVSRASFRQPTDEYLAFTGDRPPVRSSTLTSQRSLPRRAESRLIPLVVKRALSYNASPLAAASPVPYADASWWGDTVPSPAQEPTQSEPRLSVGDVHANRDRVRRRGSNNSSGSFGRGVAPPRHTPVHRDPSRRARGCESIDGDSFSVSPVSHCTAASESSRSTGAHRSGRVCSNRLDHDQSVLLDIDSLCTEASSVLSSSRGMDSSKPSRRGSISSSMFSSSNSHKRGKSLSKLRLGRMRPTSQMKRLWVDINDLYGIVVTHGPHLLEEKIVSRSSMETGLLGPWNSQKKGRSSNLRVHMQTGVVLEAIRKLDSILLWQQRLIVAIRRDHHEQRKALRQADRGISQAYLRSLEASHGNR